MSPLRPIACALLLAATAWNTRAHAGEAPVDRLQHCRSIPDDSYQTGLFFNPDGLQTYYDRARCYQDLAVLSRDAALCARVVQRRSWFLDGSGISPGACRKRVAAQDASDIAAASRKQAPQQLREVIAERDNNGRDFSVRLRTTGGDGANLQLTLSIIDAAGREHPLRVASQPMDSAPGEVLIFIPADLLARTSGTPMDQSVRLRATLQRVLVGPDDRAIYAHAPGLLRPSSVETRFVPAALKRVVMPF
jgi:hypothetical protein